MAREVPEDVQPDPARSQHADTEAVDASPGHEGVYRRPWTPQGSLKMLNSFDMLKPIRAKSMEYCSAAGAWVKVPGSRRFHGSIAFYLQGNDRGLKPKLQRDALQPDCLPIILLGLSCLQRPKQVGKSTSVVLYFTLVRLPFPGQKGQPKSGCPFFQQGQWVSGFSTALAQRQVI